VLCSGLGEGGGEGGEGRSSPRAARPRGRLPCSQGRRQEHGARSQEREATSRCASLRCLRHLRAAWAGVPTPAAPRGVRPRALRRLRCAAPPPVRAPHAALALSRFPKIGKPGGHAPRPAGGPAPTPRRVFVQWHRSPPLVAPSRAGGAGGRVRPAAGRDLHGVAAAPGGGPARVAPGCLSLAAIPILADADHGLGAAGCVEPCRG